MKGIAERNGGIMSYRNIDVLPHLKGTRLSSLSVRRTPQVYLNSTLTSIFNF